MATQPVTPATSELTDDGMEEFDGSTTTASSSPNGGLLNFIDQNMCSTCGGAEKLFGQKWCDSCACRIKRARNHANRHGPVHKKAFQDIQKVGGKLLLDALEKFEGECMTFGRGSKRPFWDWAQYSQSVEVSTNVAHGNVMVWFTRTHYAWWFSIRNGGAVERCNEEYDKLCDSLPPARVRPDRSEILVPEKDYVNVETLRTQKDTVTMGYKPIKNPGAGDFASLSHYCGHGHQEIQNPMIARQLGLKEGMLEGLGAVSLSRGDPVTAITEDAQNAADALKEKQDTQKDKLKQARLEKQAARPFSSSAQLSLLRPKLMDRCNSITSSISEAVSKADALMKDIDADSDALLLFKDARITLELRNLMLEAFRGDHDQTVESNIGHWDEFIKDEVVMGHMHKNKEPHPDLQQLKCLNYFKKEIYDMELTGWDDLKNKKDDIDKQLKICMAVVSHVTSHTTRLKNLMAARQRKKDKEGTNAQEALAHDAQSTVAAARKAHLKTQNARVGVPKFKHAPLLDHLDVVEKSVEKYSDSELLELDSHESAVKPWIMDFSGDVDKDADAWLQKMLEKFQKSDLYKGSGRASELIVDAKGNKTPACVITVVAKTLKCGMVEDDVTYCSQPSSFGMAHDAVCCGGG